MPEGLEAIAEKLLASFQAKNDTREQALEISRRVVRLSANAIRAVHRAEFDQVEKLLAEAGEALGQLNGLIKPHHDIHAAGYVQAAHREYAEAHLTYALVQGEKLPDPEALDVEQAPYLNALGDAVGEMRRHMLDLIRQDRLERGEEILQAMEDIYGVLSAFDFPDALTQDLRRTTDMVRGVVERTQGDLTLALRQSRLERALRELEDRLPGV